MDEKVVGIKRIPRGKILHISAMDNSGVFQELYVLEATGENIANDIYPIFPQLDCDTIGEPTSQH